MAWRGVAWRRVLWRILGAQWKSVIPIDSHGVSLIDSLESQLFTSHTTLGPMRALMEENPFISLSLPKLRARCGTCHTDLARRTP